jgi:hypothetical protein
MNAITRHLEITWFGLSQVVAMLITMFGNPAELFLRQTLRRVTRQDILHWLAPAEALARRLLALEATQLPAPNAPTFTPRPGRIATRCAGTCAREENEDPAQWRVRFALWPEGYAHRPRMGEAAYTFPITRFDNAAPLARRLEALLRVMQDRTGALHRMARLLAARRAAAWQSFTPYRARMRVCPVDTDLRETQAMLDNALTDTS